MITIDEKKIDRLKQLDALLMLNHTPWDYQGITIQYGQMVGSTGWKISSSRFQYSATRDDLNDAIDDLLAQLETAFSKKVQQMEQHLQLIKSVAK